MADAIVSKPKTVNPSPGRIVVRRLEKVSKVGNIHLPDSAQQKHPMGVIIAIGEPKKDEVPWMRKGMVVLFNDYGFGKFPPDENIAIVGYNDILGEVVDA